LAAVSYSLAQDSGADLPALRNCSEELDALAGHYRSVLPPELYHTDRRLGSMAAGTVILTGQIHSLIAHFKLESSGAGERILLSNAVMGCEGFKQALKNHVEVLLKFALSLWSLCLLLLIWLVWGGFAALLAWKKDLPQLTSCPKTIP
jgi:hypothetical protein